MLEAVLERVARLGGYKLMFFGSALVPFSPAELAARFGLELFAEHFSAAEVARDAQETLQCAQRRAAMQK